MKHIMTCIALTYPISRESNFSKQSNTCKQQYCQTTPLLHNHTHCHPIIVIQACKYMKHGFQKLSEENVQDGAVIIDKSGNEEQAEEEMIVAHLTVFTIHQCKIGKMCCIK